jgi:hypothetical protein
MSESKPWYASVGVWGAVVGLIGSTLSLLKVQVDPTFLADLREWLLSLATLIASGAALYGRLRASQRIRPPGAPSSMLLILLVAALCTISLAGCASASDAYVAADHATYDAIAPEYAAYVAQDPLLGVTEKNRRARTLDAWRLRIESAAPLTTGGAK